MEAKRNTGPLEGFDAASLIVAANRFLRRVAFRLPGYLMQDQLPAVAPAKEECQENDGQGQSQQHSGESPADISLRFFIFGLSIHGRRFLKKKTQAGPVPERRSHSLRRSKIES